MASPLQVLTASALFSWVIGCSSASGSSSNETRGESDVTGDGDGDFALGDGDGDDVILGVGGMDPMTSDGGTEGDDPDIMDSGTGGADSSGGTASGSGGSAPIANCSANPSGDYVVIGDTVLDERTCLTWMRTNTSGDVFQEAESFCGALDLGGFTDWRLPNAGEAATLFRCDGSWPPIDDTIFNVMGEAFWTSTKTDPTAGDHTKVCGAKQGSEMFAELAVGENQHTRCVRGASDTPDRVDCQTNQEICQ